jgi:HPt (histidine-containing phosphotransfer) domain-containing protein
MDDYVSKPIQPEQLNRALERWLPDHSIDAGDAGASPLESAEDPLDAAVIARIKDDLEPAMRERLLATFDQSLSTSLERIEAAVECDDRPELRQAAHRLKGGSATIGARALSEACRALEQQVHTDRPELAAQAKELGELGHATLAELRERLL